jgi:hypothetical protein
VFFARRWQVLRRYSPFHELPSGKNRAMTPAHLAQGRCVAENPGIERDTTRYYSKHYQERDSGLLLRLLSSGIGTTRTQADDSGASAIGES